MLPLFQRRTKVALSKVEAAPVVVGQLACEPITKVLLAMLFYRNLLIIYATTFFLPILYLLSKVHSDLSL